MQAPDPSTSGTPAPARGSIRQQQQQQGFRQELLQQLQGGVSHLSGNNSRVLRQMEQGNTFVYHPNEPQPSQAPNEQLASMNMMRTGQQLQAHMQNMANSQLRAQLQARQFARLAAMQRPAIASTSGFHLRPPSWRPPVPSESSSQRNPLSDLPAQMGHVRRQQPILSGFQQGDGTSTVLNSYNIHMQQQFGGQNRENQNMIVPRAFVPGNGGMSSMSQAIVSPIVHPRILVPSQGGPVQRPQPLYGFGFTQHQFTTLKAQVFAFKCLNRGERELPDDLLRAIAPPPLHLQPPQLFFSPEKVCQDPIGVRSSELQGRFGDSSKNLLPAGHIQKGAALVNQPLTIASIGQRDQTKTVMINSQQEVGKETQYNHKQAKVVPGSAQLPVGSTIVDCRQPMRPASAGSLQAPKGAFTIPYQSPHLLHPNLTSTRRLGSFGVAAANLSKNVMLVYDTKDLLSEEGKVVFNKKRAEDLNRLTRLLAVDSERKMIKSDLALRLKIEEKKLRLSGLQTRMRNEVDQQQREIMAMPDRLYERFTKQCERRRNDLLKQCQLANKAARKKQLKSIFHWRKKFLEAQLAIRESRTICNRGVLKYHEKILKEFSKRKDEDRTKRMEALKNNDVDRYREMLLEQQFDIPGDAAERYSVLSSFLSQTEEYLFKFGQKIIVAKNPLEVDEAANPASVAARFQALSVEDAMSSSAACAGEDGFSEMNSGMDSSSANKYYNLAHAIKEGVVRQPSMLQAGTLRDYQIVGLEWMLSLYNNKLNGILADEMGLGKTVQVMALIAYLMEFKGNYGPHLIIVPNAVLVNWKSELLKWLPSVSCIFYIGTKDQRSRLFSQVLAVRFNVLVTSYEFVMHDRTKLSKIDWKYIIIDEAQRMKDRESVLARDLDKYRCQRRLLLTGTPLQNDLKELWSLLNLLLPEVFDNGKAFHDWFSEPFRKDSSSHNADDDWLETEKKVIIIHRLHQILEPFMLRRRVEDVESALPSKVSVVLRCSMSPFQSCIYDWIKSSGTIRVDPEDELRRVEKNPRYQVKKYKHLTNKCMELRKVCNHPLLNYPYFNDYSKEFIVRSCGKLWVLDRVLMKLQRAGHRVLLFSTMTKLLDILEEYLQWRQLTYRRIDGTSSLQDRESAIMDFNSPDSTCFIFLLSIRAAGRGLNLQTADTVVIYDPDPNPHNEVQAVARVHRIGQKREVKVIYMEALADKISSHQKEDDLMNGGTGVIEDDPAAKDRYMGSVESLIRDKIQQYKIDMADEVINAGRFDQRTTHEERRITLETLLYDEERYQESVYDVPSLQEVNRMIARSEEEIKLFDQMDEEFDWGVEIMKYNQVPKWLRSGSQELNAVIDHLSKKSSKKFLTSDVEFGSSELFPGLSPCDTERRGRRKCRQTGKNCSIYRVLDSEDYEDFGASSDEMESSSHEVVEIEDFEDMEFDVDGQPSNKDQQSGSWNQDLDDNEEGVIHQPTIKRKRSKRSRPRCNVEKPEKCSSKSVVSQHSSQVPSDPVAVKCYERGSAFKHKWNLTSKKVPNTALPQPETSGFLFGPADGSMQMKCKNVISYLQMRINKDGDQIIPILSDFWKKSKNPSFVSQAMTGNNLDLQKIDQRLDFLGYVTVSDFAADVQLALKNAVQSCNDSNEVRNEAMKLNNIFFNIMKNSFPEINKWATSNSMAFFQPGVLSSPLQLHLDILVTCKKKRKHRERPTVIKWIPLQQQQQGAGGHDGNSFVSKDIQGSKPAKRMKTGAGTKRATHRRRR